MARICPYRMLVLHAFAGVVGRHKGQQLCAADRNARVSGAAQLSSNRQTSRGTTVRSNRMTMTTTRLSTESKSMILNIHEERPADPARTASRRFDSQA